MCWRFGAAGFEWCSFCRLKHNLVFHSSTITMMHQVGLSFFNYYNDASSWSFILQLLQWCIKLVFHSSTITMMHGPINIRFKNFDSFYEVSGVLRSSRVDNLEHGTCGWKGLLHTDVVVRTSAREAGRHPAALHFAISTFSKTSFRFHNLHRVYTVRIALTLILLTWRIGWAHNNARK